jgi:hypothetical protein
VFIMAFALYSAFSGTRSLPDFKIPSSGGGSGGGSEEDSPTRMVTAAELAMGWDYEDEEEEAPVRKPRKTAKKAPVKKKGVAKKAAPKKRQVKKVR